MVSFSDRPKLPNQSNFTLIRDISVTKDNPFSLEKLLTTVDLERFHEQPNIRRKIYTNNIELTSNIENDYNKNSFYIHNDLQNYQKHISELFQTTIPTIHTFFTTASITNNEILDNYSEYLSKFKPKDNGFGGNILDNLDSFHNKERLYLVESTKNHKLFILEIQKKSTNTDFNCGLCSFLTQRSNEKIPIYIHTNYFQVSDICYDTLASDILRKIIQLTSKLRNKLKSDLKHIVLSCENDLICKDFHEKTANLNLEFHSNLRISTPDTVLGNFPVLSLCSMIFSLPSLNVFVDISDLPTIQYVFSARQEQ